jgi:hypothetical protein
MALDIKGLTGNLVDLGFELAGQITASVTFTHRTGAVYDPSTGSTAETEETASVDAILQSYRSNEIDGDRIRVGDRRAIIKQSALTGITAFDQQDTITIGEERWQVVDFSVDPAEGVWKGQLRKI